MMKYPDRAEAIVQEVVIPLGEYVSAYDIGAIADELIIRVGTTTEYPGFTRDESKDFWQVVRQHSKPASEIDRYMEAIQAAGAEENALLYDPAGEFRNDLSEAEQDELERLGRKNSRLIGDMARLVEIISAAGVHPASQAEDIVAGGRA